ncbi:hypothetical protein [Streptomyces sp. NPDC007205]|uniref:hypothetical protein n=1 Tax=Streptomyces sp. NPDC007205 TaxID=3154316 RepID=UPI0033FBD424
MIHSHETVAAERIRVRQRPRAESAPPVLAAFTVDVADGAPEAYARRVRDVLSAAALHLACTAQFGDEELPADAFPDWFTAVSARDGEVREGFAQDGRTAYLRRGAGGPWGGESFFGSLDLLWLLYAAGAAHVEGPEVRKAGTWVSEAGAR